MARLLSFSTSKGDGTENVGSKLSPSSSLSFLLFPPPFFLPLSFLSFLLSSCSSPLPLPLSPLRSSSPSLSSFSFSPVFSLLFSFLYQYYHRAYHLL